MPGDLLRVIVHPEGWFAGARAMIASSAILLSGLAVAAAGILLVDTALIGLGVLLSVGAVGLGVSLAYAAVQPRRRKTDHPADPSYSMRQDDGMLDAVLAVINARFDDLNARFDRHEERHRTESSVIEQRLSAQTNQCALRMKPLDDFMEAARDAQLAREARVGPLRAGAKWLLDNWAKVAVLMGGLIGFLAFLHQFIRGLWV